MEHNISIIIPVHNRTDELSVCLLGLMTQTLIKHMQIVIVDDASTETGPEKMAKSFNADYIRSNKRHGSGYSKNLGLINSREEFALFLDSDIEFLNNTTIEAMRETLVSNFGYGQVGGEAILSADGQIKYVFGRNIDITTGSSRCDYIDVGLPNCYDHIWEYDYIPTSNCMMRRELALQANGFDDAYIGIGEDKDFGYRIKKMGYKNYVLKEAAVLHKFSVTSRLEKMRVKNQRARLRFLIRHFGFKTAILEALFQTFNLLASFDKQKKIELSSEPSLRKYELHYLENILEVNISSNMSKMSTWKAVDEIWSALFWNFVHRKGIKKFGSGNLIIHDVVNI